MGFLGSWRQYRRFASLDPERRNIVVYSESSQDWHHFEPIVAYLTEKLGRTVCYVSSDPGDPGLSIDPEQVLPFLIERGLARIIFFQVFKADVAVLTMMDLGNSELRRSLRPVHYVYLFHSLGSTHMADLEASYDHYDTILCAGPQHVREIRRREELKGLPPKRLVEHGYARLEKLIAERQTRGQARGPAAAPPTLLIAPTWGDRATLEVCGERLVRVLLEAGFRVILRPHYQTVVRAPELIEGLRRDFAAHPRFEYIDRMAETESLFRSDLLVSDWSAMAIEYALGLEKPVLFVDVPPRVRNPDYEELGLEPLEIQIRREAGAVVDPSHLEQAPGLVRELLARSDEFRGRAAELRGRWVFNLGRSAEAGALEIARIADDLAAERRASHAR